jgi:glycosyltransferase involved in cell wall biosynthesis/CDP-glycerol glycerophosphotransferase (TagB/SpsB family)
MSMVGAQARAPRFSIVSAVYNVARYLGEFIESIEAQTFLLDQVEVIIVNDGSTDESLEIVEAWQRRRPELVTVISKPNGGQASARNAAFEHLRGEWVTFADPDDVLSTNYLAEVDAFLRKRPTTVLAATHRVVFSDTTRAESRHPLHVHFVKGVNRFRNLDYDSGHFHGHASGSFFRVDLLRRAEIRFDERLRTAFEDGHFCNIYLLHTPDPLVGYLSSAVYNYRKRDDGTSTLDRSWTDPGRFTDVFEFGFLDLLRAGVQRSGRAPTWLQGMVLYELYWYFRTNDRFAAPTAAYGPTLVRFHELFDQVCDLLDEMGIDSYYATRYKPEWREILLHGRKNEPWHTDYAIVDQLDIEQKLMRVSYHFTGELPDETFVVYSSRAQPVHQKIRDVRFFDRTMLYERIVWLPFGTLRVVLDGRDLDVRTIEPERINHRLNGVRIQQALDPASAPAIVEAPRRKLSHAAKLLVRLSSTAVVRRYFRDAWVLIDRIFNADDSAEHLFDYLRKNRPEVNAWFVLERGTADYRRLQGAAGRRVIPHGSLRWKLLMLNCQHLVSSHIDDVIVKLPEITKLIDPKWRFTFLQHGVIKDDLSTWLNRKNIGLFVTSTPAEFESIAGDHTAYRYTSREAKLTGLPRFDRILEEGNRFPPENRDLILIAPTWRQWLTSADRVTGRHSVDPAAFASSEYATMWTSFINSPDLRELAEHTGLTVALLLHPNLQDTATLDTPPHVRRLQFEGQNIQELFARARVLVTDYSSMFFNAAYIERPVVYFQFDRQRVLGGWHVGRSGYFDYERDGFGSVTLTVDDAVAATVKAIENGPAPEPVYLERINATFPNRDGRCSERVADAIAESTLANGATRRPSPKRRSVKHRVKSRARQLARRIVSRSPRARRAVARWRSPRTTKK